MKTKKERLEIKTRRLKNKKLIKKYPFIQAVDWLAKPIKSYDYTLLDDMPTGWKKSFGELLCEDISKVLKRHNVKTFNTQQVKEKYGELRWYFSAPTCVYNEIDDIIDAYSHCSRNICIRCGKLDVHCIDTGWISPLCEECFYKNKYYKDKNYNDYICDEDNLMSDSITFSRFEDGKTTKYTIDISEYTNKIRMRYKKDVRRNS